MRALLLLAALAHGAAKVELSAPLESRAAALAAPSPPSMTLPTRAINFGMRSALELDRYRPGPMARADIVKAMAGRPHAALPLSVYQSKGRAFFGVDLSKDEEALRGLRLESHERAMIEKVKTLTKNVRVLMRDEDGPTPDLEVDGLLVELKRAAAAPFERPLREAAAQTYSFSVRHGLPADRGVAVLDATRNERHADPESDVEVFNGLGDKVRGLAVIHVFRRSQLRSYVRGADGRWVRYESPEPFRAAR